MVSPEYMIDDERLSRHFNDGMDKIGYSFMMNSEQKLYLMGRIIEIVKFEMCNSEQLENK